MLLVTDLIVLSNAMIPFMGLMVPTNCQNRTIRTKVPTLAITRYIFLYSSVISYCRLTPCLLKVLPMRVLWSKTKLILPKSFASVYNQSMHSFVYILTCT